MNITGYLSSNYAFSLSGFGHPIQLVDCQGWLLRRTIPNSSFSDATGCYPLFCCLHWKELQSDLAKLPHDLATVSLVTDPFSDFSRIELESCFSLVKPFKEHFVIKSDELTEHHVSRHHRYYSLKALQQLQVEVVADSLRHLDEWVELYDLLVKRHKLTGIKAFPRCSFEQQFQIPGFLMLRAVYQGKAVGMHLWFIQSGVAYSHLAAFNDSGYSLGAAYALYWTAIELFKRDFGDRVFLIDLGAGAGVGTADNGLSQFKRGWATAVRLKYFCGKVLNSDIYEQLIRDHACTDFDYFPPYRHAEMS